MIYPLNTKIDKESINLLALIIVPLFVTTKSTIELHQTSGDDLLRANLLLLRGNSINREGKKKN